MDIAHHDAMPFPPEEIQEFHKMDMQAATYVVGLMLSGLDGTGLALLRRSSVITSADFGSSASAAPIWAA